MDIDEFTTTTFIDILEKLNMYDNDFIIRYYLSTITYELTVNNYLESHGYLKLSKSYDIEEFKKIIDDIKSISFDDFKDIYNFNKPIFNDKEKKSDETTLKGYVNSTKFTIFKFMFLNKNIKKYIILLFNSKKAIDFLYNDVNMILYDFENFDYSNEFVEELNMNEFYPILILKALKSNKFISILNYQYFNIKILENVKKNELRKSSKKKKDEINDIENINLFGFLKTKDYIKNIIQIIAKMKKIHTYVNSNNNKKYSKFSIIHNPGFNAFLKFEFEKEDIKEKIGYYLYKHYDSFIKSKTIFDKLVKLLQVIKKFKNDNFFKEFLDELNTNINKDFNYYNITETFDSDGYQNQMGYYSAFNSWLREKLFIETINIIIYYYKFNTKLYNISDSNSSDKSNKHLTKLIKNTNFNEIEDIEEDDLLIR
jgi:hypothetical protein